MAQTTLGIELDGDRVTVVECVGEMAVSMRTVALDDASEAVDLVLAGIKIKRNDAAIRVSLATPSTVARRIDVTPAMLARDAFEDAVYTALPVDREQTCSAGLFFERNLLVSGVDQLSSGAAAIAPRAAVSAAYRAMRDRRTEIIPSPFAFEGWDGLWLGLRYSAADLTLVVDGHIVAYRQLRAGGLDGVAGLLADLNDPDSGRARVQTALHRSGLSDPIAEAELDRWLRLIAGEVRQTLNFWTRGGETVPTTLCAFGPGAAAVGIDGALSDIGVPVAFPEEITRLLAFIAPADRSAIVGAYFAARSVGAGMPSAAFVDPDVVEASVASTKRNRRTLVIGSLVALGALVVGTVIAPTTAALVGREVVNHSRDNARKEFEPLQATWAQITEAEQRRAIVISAASSEIDYAAVLRIVASSTPSGYQLGQVSLTKDTDGDVVASLSATGTGGSYQDLANWLTVLRARPEIKEAWSSSFTDRDKKVSFSVTTRFTSTKVVAEKRPITGEVTK